jgi:hypothetical protein
VRASPVVDARAPIVTRARAAHGAPRETPRVGARAVSVAAVTNDFPPRAIPPLAAPPRRTPRARLASTRAPRDVARVSVDVDARIRISRASDVVDGDAFATKTMTR